MPGDSPAAEALRARLGLGSRARGAHSGPRPGALRGRSRASTPVHPQPVGPVRLPEPHRPLPNGPDTDLPVFALVFLLLPHRVTAALAAPAPLFALSQIPFPPADFGLHSAPLARAAAARTRLRTDPRTETGHIWCGLAVRRRIFRRRGVRTQGVAQRELSFG